MQEGQKRGTKENWRHSWGGGASDPRLNEEEAGSKCFGSGKHLTSQTK
jgi:hypothetical protein